MESKNIITFAKWQVSKGQLENVLSLLKEAVINSRAEQGNVNYQVFQGYENDHTVLLFEEYIDKEALDFHRSSPHFQEIVVQQIVPLLENREVILASLVEL